MRPRRPVPGGAADASHAAGVHLGHERRERRLPRLLPAAGRRPAGDGADLARAHSVRRAISAKHGAVAPRQSWRARPQPSSDRASRARSAVRADTLVEPPSTPFRARCLRPRAPCRHQGSETDHSPPPERAGKLPTIRKSAAASFLWQRIEVLLGTGLHPYEYLIFALKTDQRLCRNAILPIAAGPSQDGLAGSASLAVEARRRSGRGRSSAARRRRRGRPGASSASGRRQPRRSDARWRSP